MAEFYQQGPRLNNQYDDDRVLIDALRRLLPADIHDAIKPDLHCIGQRVVGEIQILGDTAEAQPPRLVSFDPWGRRIDRIDVSPAWRALERISAEEGLVAIGYERHYGPWSRLYQFAKLYLFNPSSATYTCPLAMTDGAARVIEVLGNDALRTRAGARLLSRDPGCFWTSGQWMTERTGGSDVGRSETVAHPSAEGFNLYGTKWFTSATTSQMALTLARLEDAHGNTQAGSRGLGLFYLETRNDDGDLNQIVIHRLKDKLGTKALPTAELTLAGTPAMLIGEVGDGVRNIATMINVTRIYNAVCALSLMRRGLALARDYARRRDVFGQRLARQPLHAETLAGLQTEFEAAAALVFHVVHLLGRHECGLASADEGAILRLLTPIAKLYTGKQSVAVASEILESFGGAGYVEDTGLPRLLRDAQVLPIWEGTTNVLSLDVLRAIDKEQALEPLAAHLEAKLGQIHHPELDEVVERIRAALARILQFAPRALAAGPAALAASARMFAFSLARTTMATLLAEAAQWSLTIDGDARALAAARRWCRQELAPLADLSRESRDDAHALAMDESLPLPLSAAPAAASISQPTPRTEEVFGRQRKS